MAFSGDTIKINFTALNENKQPIDLTSNDIMWSISRTVDGPVIVSKGLTNGISITDADGGKFTVTLEPDDTKSFNGSYYHEAKIIKNSGVYTVFAGTIKFQKTLIDV